MGDGVALALGEAFFAFTAWFRVHLMGDEANRKFFFGPDCTLCTDSRVTVQRNGLMMQSSEQAGADRQGAEARLGRRPQHESAR